METARAVQYALQHGGSMRKDVPKIVVARLPVYLRDLSQLRDEGKEVTSSQELGKRLGISPAQIRKDLSHFGEFGKQGTGYNVSYLIEQLRRILHADRNWKIILVGAGDLGHAMVHYTGFRKQGLHIIGVFDNDPQKIGQRWGELTVMDASTIEDFIQKENVKIVILAVPAKVAQQVADRLVNAGIRAILNYAPIVLHLPNGILVEYIDPVVHLQYMTYFLE